MPKKTNKTGISAERDFLPTNCREMDALGWDCCDVVIVTGDAYIDHPAFGAALVGRFLESRGLRVGIIAMPDVKNPADFTALGRPRLFFGVSAGNLDSLVSRFTAAKKIRSDDPYVPGGMRTNRPERALIVYCNALRSVYKEAPIVIGGIEASLRRIAHYDYWSDTVRRPIVLDCKADLAIYGMAEKPLGILVDRLSQGASLRQQLDIPQTVVALGKQALADLEKSNA
ncbi:MAG: hypothetical protein PHC61_18740, partial [Chitinivibrionales bacterium]|nr:hypothetical protein [Chitinivibrionales bacterium]